VRQFVVCEADGKFCESSRMINLMAKLVEVWTQ